MAVPEFIIMSFKPDYGLRLIREGYSQQVDLNFYDFRLFNIDVLGRGQYSTMNELPYKGQLHALSLDFNQTHLDQILLKATPQIRQYVENEIFNDPDTARTIDFEGEITIGVRVRLGQIQKVARASFAPLVVQEIL